MSVIPDREMEVMQQMVGDGTHGVEVDEIDCAKGDLVELINGRLRGLKGVIWKQAGKENFVIELKVISKSLIMTVNKSDFRKIKDACNSF